MSSTEKRDALARELAEAWTAFEPERNLPEAEQTVGGVVAEALRNAAERLECLLDTTQQLREVSGLRRAADALRADADALEDGSAGPAQPRQPGRFVEEWRTAAGIPTPPSADELRRSLREYTVGALDTAAVDPGADAAYARRALRAAGLKTYATDAELESFQALRRQIAGETPKLAEQIRHERTIAALVHLLDKADTPPGMGRQAAMQDLRDTGLPIPQATDDEWNSAIVQRRERQDPER